MNRIWWQSFSAVEWAGAYRDYMLQHAKDLLQGEAEFYLAGLPASTFGGHPPMSLLGDHYASHRLMMDIPEYAIQAEAEGYDAFVIQSYTEPHLKVLRSAVDITVVSVVESTLLTACTTAAKIGIVVITEDLRRIVQETVARHGLGSRVGAVVVMDPLVLEHEIVAGFDNPGSLVDRFEVAAQACVAAGCDVVIPGEGILGEVLHSADVIDAAGAPVVDTFGIGVLHAQFQINARKRANLRPGRLFSYPKLTGERADFIRNYKRA
jgi:allantoin racemase